MSGPQISSANRKSPKRADLNNLLDLRTFRKCGTMRICDLRAQSFCDLRTYSFRKLVLTNIAYSKMLKFCGLIIKICYLRTSTPKNLADMQ